MNYTFDVRNMVITPCLPEFLEKKRVKGKATTT